MPAQQATTNSAPPVVVSPSTGDDERVRDVAIKRIERKHRFHIRAFSAVAVSVVLVIIWAITEYHNAGGWPTSGFSQSSGIPHEWNSWIIYPILAVALGLAIDAWNTYRHRTITEAEIRREMDRLRDAH